MTLSVELTPGQVEALREEAARRGVSLEEYAKAVLQGSLPARENGTVRAGLSLDEEERLLHELASIEKDLPAPGETYARETIYADHD